jgi:hypothetical protein
MQSSGDASLLRRLAVSLGQGLAVGVGVKLSQDALRPKAATTANAAAAPPDAAPFANRIEQIEHKLQELDRPRPAAAPQPAPFDPKAIQVIVNAVETHLKQHAAKVQERIDDLQSSVIAAADASAAKRIHQEVSALRAQVATMHREFSGTVGQSVADQVAAQVSAQAGALHAAIQQNIHAAVAPLRADLQDLRIRLTQNDTAPLRAAVQDLQRRVSESDTTSLRSELQELRRRFANEDAAPWRPEIDALRLRLAKTEVGQELPPAKLANTTAPITRAVDNAPREDASEPLPVPMRGVRLPERVDLRTIRRRLSEAGRPAVNDHPAFVPWAAETPQRRTLAAVRSFPKAS